MRGYKTLRHRNKLNSDEWNVLYKKVSMLKCYWGSTVKCKSGRTNNKGSFRIEVVYTSRWLLQAVPKASPPQQALKRRPLFYVLRVHRHTIFHQNPEQTATSLASSNTVCTRSTVIWILSENQQWFILSTTKLNFHKYMNSSGSGVKRSPPGPSASTFSWTLNFRP